MATTLTTPAPTPEVPPNGAPPSGTPPDWRASLPEELRADKALETFKDTASLAKSYIDTKKMVGDAIRMPKGDAPQAEWDKFYERTGRPESADKYEFKLGGDANTKHDDELIGEFKNMAHQAGLNPRQAQALLDGYTKFSEARLGKQATEMQAGLDTLKKEWGGAWDNNLSSATRAVKELGGEELSKVLDETGLGNHPVLVKFFAKLGKEITEEPVIVGDATEQQSSLDAIQTKINAIMADPKHPYRDGRASQQARDAALREMQGYYKQIAALTGNGE